MSPNQNGIFVRTCHDLKKDLRLNKLGIVKRVEVSNGELAIIQSQTSSPCIHVNVSQNTRDRAAELGVGVSSRDELDRVHISPCGRHAILSSKEGDNFYLNLRSNTVHPVKKIKGTVTAVAWNPDIGNADTGSILLGTSKGMIIEASITSGGKENYVKEYQWNAIDREQPISDMYLFLTNDEEEKKFKYLLIVCIPGRLFVIQATIDATPKSNYVGSTSLQAGWVAIPEKELNIFGAFFKQRDPYSLKSQEGSPSCSRLRLHADAKVTNLYKFVWLGSSGFTVGTINLTMENVRLIIKEERTVEHRRVDGSIEWPLSISMTEYHVLLLFPYRLTALSYYTGTVVYEDQWPREYGEGIDLSFDATSQIHWTCTKNVLLKYRPNDETRYVWNVYLDRGDFARALAIARERKSMDADAFELVLRRQADKYISEKNYGAAAEILANSSESFETLVLRLIIDDDERKTGLRTLLDKKLEQLRENDDRMKKDTLFMWLLEMQLSELGEARKELAMIGMNPSEAEEKVERLTRQMQAFLMRKNVQDTVQKLKDAIYRLMQNHADVDSQLFVANLLKDYETIVRIRIGKDQYREALGTLVSVGSADLFCQFSPLLLAYIPSPLIEAIKRCQTVRALRIIPILCAACDERSAEVVLSYVEWAISFPSAPESLHNVYISFLAKIKPNRLLGYLENQGKDLPLIHYSMDHAIRTAKHHDAKRCLVFLYCVAEMWSEAMNIALKEMSDISLGKRIAEWMDSSLDGLLFTQSTCTVSIETRRAIWLSIARAMIDSGEEVGRCLYVLTESRDAIKIQDLLPLLPEFTRMEELKDPLVACLKEHSAKISVLQQQMKYASDTANEMRTMSEKMKKRVTIVRSMDVCESCRCSLCSRSFYAFACRHHFHRDCLEREMVDFMSDESKKTLAVLVEKERRILAELEYEDRKGGKAYMNQEKEEEAMELSTKISEIIGRECPLCSNMAIEQIDVPFLSDEEFELECNSWAF
ncbi:vps-18 [Pristionchus pacificus]|uniref:Vacuolar protein sorting-associated protein 18 homolog n=1 Tax=Pristionchus pacificus TaxID=54126 RepID=A0A8R1YIS5_PRIPA|nr:vps-18 [Pristionchus pacificus]